jgi:hypothetical protein
MTTWRTFAGLGGEGDKGRQGVRTESEGVSLVGGNYDPPDDIPVVYSIWAGHREQRVGDNALHCNGHSNEYIPEEIFFIALYPQGLKHTRYSRGNQRPRRNRKDPLILILLRVISIYSLTTLPAQIRQQLSQTKDRAGPNRFRKRLGSK